MPAQQEVGDVLSGSVFSGRVSVTWRKKRMFPVGSFHIPASHAESDPPHLSQFTPSLYHQSVPMTEVLSAAPACAHVLLGTLLEDGGKPRE